MIKLIAPKILAFDLWKCFEPSLNMIKGLLSPGTTLDLLRISEVRRLFNRGNIMHSRVSQKNFFFNFVSAVEPLVRTSSQSPRKKFQCYRPINDTLTTIWNFGLIWGWNGSETGLKTWFSKIGLILPRKWKHMTQMSTPPFWGVFREVFGVRS